MSQLVYEFVYNHPFEKPMHRLILLCVLANGSSDGKGERILGHETLSKFCCCSRQAVFRELKALERAGYLRMRKIGEIAMDGTVRIEPVRGYTIIVGEG